MAYLLYFKPVFRALLGIGVIKGFIKTMLKILPVAALALSLLLTPVYAHADGMPYQGHDDNTADVPGIDSALRLTLDQTKMVNLDEDAESVIVTNTDYASVMLDTPRLLIIVPHREGSTVLTVLNRRGQVILHKNVIVMGAAQKKYMRIRRVCGTDSSCVSRDYYYCPDGCYEITPLHPDTGSTTAPPAPIASSAPMPSGGAAPAPAASNPEPDDATAQPDEQGAQPPR